MATHAVYKTILVLAMAVSAILMVSLTVPSSGTASDQPYSITALADAGLRDQHGNKITARSLEDRLVLVNFFFTHCGDTCPIQTAVIRDVQAALDLKNDDPLLLSVSIAPLSDTDAAIREYIDKFQLSETNWKFVKTNPEDTAKLVDNFAVTAAEFDQDNGITNHRNMGFLFGRDGRMMQQYQLTPNMVKRLSREITALQRWSYSG